MPITSTGYDGSVGETAWGQQATMYGADAGVAGVSDFAVTLSGGDTVRVAPGVAYGRGVVDILDVATTITMKRPDSGVRYDLVLLRRDWSANATTLVVVSGGSTRVVPTLVDNGKVLDQPLALVMIPAGTVNMTISDDLRVTHAPVGSAHGTAGMQGPLGSRYIMDDGSRWVVGPAGPVREWDQAHPTIPPIPIIESGRASITTGTHGTARITHGLPWTPDVVICDNRTTETSGIVQVSVSAAAGSITSSYFVVNAKIRTKTGWETYVGPITYVDWVATKANSVDSTTPIVTGTPYVPPTQLPGTATADTSTPVILIDPDASSASQDKTPQLPPDYSSTTQQVSSAQSVLTMAASQIGVTESPSGSNHVKYWVDEQPSLNGQPWCAAFTTWVYRRCGIVVTSAIDITNPYYTPTLESGARAKGLWYTDTPRPGDMVIYGNSKLPYGTTIGTASDGSKIIAKASHVAIVEKWLPDIGRVQEIGGNTSDGLNGSPNNGGGVFRNRRNPNSTTFPIRGYIRMPTAVPTALRVQGQFPLPAGHYFGVADAASTLDHNGTAGSDATGVRQIQAEVGVAVDGEFGPITESAVKQWQASRGRTQTGRVYAEDWAVFVNVNAAPPRPTGIVATAGDNAATVVFNASTGAQQYTATLYGTSTTKTAAASPITFTGLTAGVPVQFTVTATNAAGASPVSARSAPVYPTEGGRPTVPLEDGSVFMVWAGSSKVPEAISTVSIASKNNTATYDAFVAKFPESKWLAGMRQAARNVSAILYGTAYTPPAARPLSFAFEGDSTHVADMRVAEGIMEVFKLGPPEPMMASWITHETTHFMQVFNGKLYGSNPQVKGITEGIADYVLVRLGYSNMWRPTGGGTNWWDGYRTTAYFIDYIENHAPTKSPGFVQRLNQTMSSPTWTSAQITPINARKMTVDALWTEYKAWVAAQ